MPLSVRALLSRCVVLGAFFSGLVLAGCSSTLPSSGVRELSPEEKVVHDAHRNQAIAHFIDGSTYELRGEIAQAVLEYQEAARYDSDHAIFAALARTYSALGKHVIRTTGRRQMSAARSPHPVLIGARDRSGEHDQRTQA